MEGIRKFLRGEPVVVNNAIVAVTTLVAAFGFALTGVQVAAIVGVSIAVSAFFTRGAVSPVHPPSE
jgi:hypothetical protein